MRTSSIEETDYPQEYLLVPHENSLIPAHLHQWRLGALHGPIILEQHLREKPSIGYLQVEAISNRRLHLGVDATQRFPKCLKPRRTSEASRVAGNDVLRDRQPGLELMRPRKVVVEQEQLLWAGRHVIIELGQHRGVLRRVARAQRRPIAADAQVRVVAVPPVGARVHPVVVAMQLEVVMPSLRATPIFSRAAG